MITHNKELLNQLLDRLPGVLPSTIVDELLDSLIENPEPSYNTIEEACANGYFMKVYPKYSYPNGLVQGVVTSYLQKRINTGLDIWDAKTLQPLYTTLGTTFLNEYVNGLGNYNITFKYALAEEFPLLTIQQWNDMYNMVMEYIGNSSFKEKYKLFKQLVAISDNAYSIGYNVALNA